MRNGRRIEPKRKRDSGLGGAILPAAELNAKAARSAYVAGKIAALSRIEAERNLVNLRDHYFEAVADYFRRRATLEPVIGGPLTPPE